MYTSVLTCIKCISLCIYLVLRKGSNNSQIFMYTGIILSIFYPQVCQNTYILHTKTIGVSIRKYTRAGKYCYNPYQ